MEFWFSEFHTPDVKHSIRVNKQLYSRQSDYQRIDIFETPEFGRVLTLDGNVMLTERDEFIYDEMIVHVPMAVHKEAKDILVIGAGDGGVGEDVFASVLGSMGFFQPVVAALVGLIPNCAASVLLTQLYVEGALRFSSLVAGLCTGAGVGLAVLWRTNPSWKQNLFITGLTWGAGAFLGVAMQVVVAVFA